MAKKAFTEHPKFMQAGQAANGALHMALIDMGLTENDLFAFDHTSDRVVDDMTKLLLRAYDGKQSKSQAA